MNIFFKQLANKLKFINATDGNVGNKALRSSVWLLIASVSINSLVIVRSIILARLLLPEIFGVFTLCTIVMRAVDVFTQSGFNTALIYNYKDYDYNKGTAFTLTLIRGVVLSMALYFMAGSISLYYKNTDIKLLTQLISVVFIIKGFKNINSVHYEKELNFKLVSIYEQVSTLLSSLITIAVVYIFRNVWALAASMIACNIVETILSYLMFKGSVKIEIKLDSARNLFRYGKFITGVSIVVFMITEFDNLIVGKLLGMEALGVYGVAYMLANIPSTHITTVVSRVMMPAYTKLIDNVGELKGAYLKTLQIVATVSIPAAFGIGVLSNQIVTVLYGPKWIAAVIPMQILCVFGGIRSLAATTGPIINALGKPKIGLYLVSLKLIVIALAIFPLTRRYGLIGASIAVVVPMILEQFLLLYLMDRIATVSAKNVFSCVYPALTCSAIMGTCVFICGYLLVEVSVFSLFGLILFGVASYVISYKTLFTDRFYVIVNRLRFSQ